MVVGRWVRGLTRRLPIARVFSHLRNISIHHVASDDRGLPVICSRSTLVTVAPKLISEPEGTGRGSILIWEDMVKT